LQLLKYEKVKRFQKRTFQKIRYLMIMHLCVFPKSRIYNGPTISKTPENALHM